MRNKTKELTESEKLYGVDLYEKLSKQMDDLALPHHNMLQVIDEDLKEPNAFRNLLGSVDEDKRLETLRKIDKECRSNIWYYLRVILGIVPTVEDVIFIDRYSSKKSTLLRAPQNFNALGIIAALLTYTIFYTNYSAAFLAAFPSNKSNDQVATLNWYMDQYKQTTLYFSIPGKSENCKLRKYKEFINLSMIDSGMLNDPKVHKKYRIFIYGLEHFTQRDVIEKLLDINPNLGCCYFASTINENLEENISHKIDMLYPILPADDILKSKTGSIVINENEILDLKVIKRLKESLSDSTYLAEVSRQRIK